MTQVVNGEAMSLAQLLNEYDALHFAMDARKPGETNINKEIEEKYLRVVEKVSSPDCSCTDTTDALAALEYIRDIIDGDDTIADSLIRTVIDWLKIQGSDRWSTLDFDDAIHRSRILTQAAAHLLRGGSEDREAAEMILDDVLGFNYHIAAILDRECKERNAVRKAVA